MLVASCVNSAIAAPIAWSSSASSTLNSRIRFRSTIPTHFRWNRCEPDDRLASNNKKRFPPRSRTSSHDVLPTISDNRVTITETTLCGLVKRREIGSKNGPSGGPTHFRETGACWWSKHSCLWFSNSRRVLCQDSNFGYAISFSRSVFCTGVEDGGVEDGGSKIATECRPSGCDLRSSILDPPVRAGGNSRISRLLTRKLGFDRTLAAR